MSPSHPLPHHIVSMWLQPQLATICPLSPPSTAAVPLVSPCKAIKRTNYNNVQFSLSIGSITSINAEIMFSKSNSYLILAYSPILINHFGGSINYELFSDPSLPNIVDSNSQVFTYLRGFFAFSQSGTFIMCDISVFWIASPNYIQIKKTRAYNQRKITQVFFTLLVINTTSLSINHVNRYYSLISLRSLPPIILLSNQPANFGIPSSFLNPLYGSF